MRGSACRRSAEFVAELAGAVARRFQRRDERGIDLVGLQRRDRRMRGAAFRGDPFAQQLEDQARYQVLEAQPEVTEAMDEARRSRTVRRSIHLTPFGMDFCKTCLPLDSVEIDALPREPGDPR